MILNTVLLIMFILVTPAPIISVEEVLLDLTTPNVRKTIQAQTTICGGMKGDTLIGDTHVAPSEAPLSLQVACLNHPKYTVGDEIVCEVHLTNKGWRPIAIPWSPDQETVFGKNCEWLPKASGATGWRAMLTLEFQSRDGYKEPIASHALYGISSNAATFRTLAPKESVRIKFAGKLYFNDLIRKGKERGVKFSLPQEFVVRASFDLDDSSIFRPYDKIYSVDSFQVKVHPE